MLVGSPQKSWVAFHYFIDIPIHTLIAAKDGPKLIDSRPLRGCVQLATEYGIDIRN